MAIPVRTIAVFALLLASASGQDGDYQLRVLAHTQFIPKGKKLGLAAWGILPNTLNQASQRRLVLTGGVYKNDKRWVEVMAGGLFSRNEPSSFVLDLRYSERYKRTNTSLEVLYNFRTDSLLINPGFTTPVRIKRLRAAVGGEADLNFGARNRNWVAGPRVVIPVPVCRRICKDASLVTAYRFHSDGRRVVRNYIALNF